MKNCGYCGRENEDSAIVCRECGQSEFPEQIAAAKAQEFEGHVEEPAPEPPEPDVGPDQEAAICPFCLFPNLPDREWCKNCGSPFNTSVMGPFESALATGAMWRGVVRGRPKAIVLWMAWLLLFPMGMGKVGIPFLILYKVTRNFLTISKQKLDE